MTPPLRSTRLHSKSAVKCGHCKKVVKEDDTSAVGCSSCGEWVHGSRFGLSDMEVFWFGTKSKMVWLCDTCVNANNICATPTTEAMLTSILGTFSEKLESNISNLVPKLFEEHLPDMNKNVKEALSKSLPSYSDNVSGDKKSNHSPELQFVITGLPEIETTYYKQIDKDTTEVKNIVQHMHLQSENNITAIRRLGRVLKANVDETGQESRARCRPLLVTTSNSRFLISCSARSHYLQDHPTPVYVKKFLSQHDHRLEKELPAKRYEMVTTEEKDRKDFKKNLKLYYKIELVEISTQGLCPSKCLLVNCQSICSFEKRYALTKLCELNSVTLVFLTRTWLYSEISNPEIFLGSSFNIIVRHNCDRGKHGGCLVAQCTKDNLNV